ncbi:MAG TPA: phenylalanine--tRNA ligase subunit beta [Candidatus Omnitrophota bacterium]|nr:phenylalanine--tRNA ligase subunit beta [Candidatus Omnitrophota bacterium]HPT07167.1 phenylalanine--tRNA ligase subunit beta [Candidatus Omnitrophota bacterium]
MKVTYNWLQDFVDITLTPEALADKLTMSGLEVKGIESVGGDFVFEIEITSNRPDWLSVLGLAREVAAITGKKLKLPALPKEKPVKGKARVSISIEDARDCPLYTAKILTDIVVGPSPEWMRRRLEMVGCRSINNVVDVTNYVMFVLGEPLHAFDFDALHTDSIVIRRAAEGESMTTIDGQVKSLSSDILVIADTKKPVAIAGVMGGKDTEVIGSTKNVLLEAAVFNQVLIRHGRQKLGMQTESSYRFERGVDIERAVMASEYAVSLIRELASGKLAGSVSEGKKTAALPAVNVCVPWVQQMLGVTVSASRMKSILAPLGFMVTAKTKDILRVVPPSFRQDVKAPVDILEDIARIYGYDKTPVTLPSIKPRLLSNSLREWTTCVRETMVGLGGQEVLTYSLIDRELFNAAGFSGEAFVAVANPLSKEQEIMRPTLIPSLLQCVARNLNQQQEYVNLFEIASVYIPVAGGVPHERLMLGIALSGSRSLLLPHGLVREEIGLLHIKGIFQALAARLGISAVSFVASRKSDEISLLLGEEVVGSARMVAQKSLDAFDIKNKSVCVAEINCAMLIGKATAAKRFVQLPKFPSVSRDVNFVVKEEISAGDVIEAVKNQAPAILRNVRITDYYKGKQIADGYKALTVSCVYRADDRTLTEAEVNPAHELVCDAVKKTLGATLR